MILNKTLPLLTLYILLSTVGCSKSENKSQIINRSLEPTECSFKPSEGSTVNINSVYTSETQLGLFDKPYNREWLHSIETASLYETIRFVNETGVQILSAEKKGSLDCNGFSSLSSISSQDEIEKEWKKLASKDNNKQYVAGLYLPQNPLSPIEALKNKSVIIVRENQERYTLVHEFMHHNFTESAKKNKLLDGNEEQKFKTHLQKAFSILKNVDSHSTDAQIYYALSACQDDFLAAFNNFDKIILGTALEEVTIESLLVDQILNNSLQFIQKDNLKQSSWYIGYSADRAESLYSNLIEDLIDPILKITEDVPHPIQSELNNLILKFKNRIEIAKNVKNKYNIYTTLALTQSNLMINDHFNQLETPLSSTVETKPCSHLDVLENISEVIKKSKFNF